jgi:serine/threonine-protein phosphatase PGAM5
MSRWLYLARHGDAQEGGGLTPAGRQQAGLLGKRLSTVPLTEVVHSPEQRAAETAAALSLPVAAEQWDAAGDYVPYVPDPVPPVLAGCTPAEREAGARWAAEALTRFANPAPEPDAHHLIVTHAFLIAWFVRDAVGAPPERWLGLNAANCGLTVIRYTPGRPAALVQFNDLGHLPPELRWTGFSAGITPA